MSCGRTTPRISRPTCLLIVFGSLFFLAVKVMQFYRFQVGGELSSFDSILWNTLRGSFLAKAPGSAPFFQEHFSPILLLLLPVYGLFQHPLTLLVIQGLAAAAAMIPLALLVRQKMSQAWAPFTVCLVYWLSRVLNHGLLYEFHMEIFYPLLFFLAFLCYEKSQHGLLVLTLVLCLMVKEDAAIPVAGFGLYIACEGKRRLGWTLFGTAVAWLILAMVVIIPAFRAGREHSYQFVQYWSGYGDNMQEVLLGWLDPLAHLRVLFTPFKLSKMFNLFSVFLFIPLLNWRRALLLIFPNWLLLYSSDNALMNSPLVYYGLLILPFLFYVTILNLADIRVRTRDRAPRVVTALLLVLAVVNFFNSKLFVQLHPEKWRVDPRYRPAKELIETIPREAPIGAQIALMPHFATRPFRHPIPYAMDSCSYLLFDTIGGTWPLSRAENFAVIDSIRSLDTWTVEREVAGFILFARVTGDRSGAAPEAAN